MPRVRPCIACGAPLDNDECATPQCPYNPDEDTKVHDAEFEYVEGVGENPTDDATFDEGSEMSDEELAELLNDDYEGEGEDQDPKDPIHSDDLTPEQREQMWEQNQDNKSDKSDKQDDNLDSKANQDAQDADDRMDMGGGDTGDMDTSEVEAEAEAEKEKEKQLTEEDLGEDPSDDALDLPEGGGDEDEEDNLPPRPSGCKGDCKPTDDPGAQDGDPCPHCTAKQFKQEMKAEGKENLPEEKMESEWQDFLDNWQDEAEEAQEREDFHEREEQMEQLEDQITQESEGGGTPDDDAPEDYVPDPNDDDLPPRPQGCAGNCAENDDPNDDGDPCPHCTAKSFKDEMRQEQEEQGKEFDPEELAERFQEMLQDRRKKIEERQEQDRNIDDLLDDDDDEPEEKPEPEPEDSERDQLIERVNKARDDFDIGVFEDLAAMSDEKLTEMFSAEELNDFGDVAENNNAHSEAERLRDLAEKMNTPPEDEMGDEHEDESEEDREQNEREHDKLCMCDDCKQKQNEDSDEKHEEQEGFKRKAKDLTVTQEKRFDNIVSRIAKKVEGTFGQTAEEIFTMPKSDGQFQGEDLSQAIQITSRGVIYWVTVSAAKDIDLS